MTEKDTQRFKAVNESRRRMVPILGANAADPAKDKDGASTGVYLGALRTLGITDFLLTGDVDSFRVNLSKSAALRAQIFRRFARGEPIDPSCVTPLAYKNVFDALAAKDFVVARDLATLIGGRPEIEKKHAHPFDNAMGYAVKAAVLAENEAVASRDLTAVLARGGNGNFAAYGVVFDRLARGQLDMNDATFVSLVTGHRAEARRGVFRDCVDAVLAVWVIGLINLVQHRGGRADFADELIPAQLVR